MTMSEYLKIPDIILSLFLHKNWTGLKHLAPTVLCGKSDQGAHGSEVNVFSFSLTLAPSSILYNPYPWS